MNLSKDEMAIRAIYADLLMAGEFTTVFRPGSRLCEEFRGYCPGQKVTARILDRIGADWAHIAPQFKPGLERSIEIAAIEVKKIGELTPEDFAGSTPDVQTPDQLIYHLGTIYNLLPSELNSDTTITKITFTYL